MRYARGSLRDKLKRFPRKRFPLVREKLLTQPAFVCSELTIVTAEQGVKYVQGYC